MQVYMVEAVIVSRIMSAALGIGSPFMCRGVPEEISTWFEIQVKAPQMQKTTDTENSNARNKENLLLA